MAWKINFAHSAKKELEKIDKKAIKRIINFLEEIAIEDDPKIKGKSLKGSLKEFWRYRVGDYRIICSIDKGELTILVLRAGHRKDIYESDL